MSRVWWCIKVVTLPAVALVVLPSAVTAQSRRVVCALDAATSAPIARVRWEVLGQGAGPRVSGTACFAVDATAADTIMIRRLGYTTWQGVVTAAADTVFAAMMPAAHVLPPTTARANACGVSRAADPAAEQRTEAACRRGESLSADRARTLGVGSTSGLVSLLPYTFPRGQRSDAAVSLRGARREQVVVTLDGLPLNDPSTGLANLGDVPLVALSGATVAPGSDPIGTGSGAAGGVLALSSGRGTLASVRVGAFGARRVEVASDLGQGATSLRVGAAYSDARNDFAFVNRSSTSGSVTVEDRVNNDAMRTSVLAQLQAPHVQIVAVASHASLGMVGPVNVRAYDADRSQNDRLFVRAVTQRGRAVFSGGVRAFGLAYRDPTRPVLDGEARAYSVDVDARRSLGLGVFRAGLGADRLRATGNVAQDRVRGFASISSTLRALSIDWVGGARLDGVGGNGLLPSASLSAERAISRVLVSARIAQAVRVPTLYDLFFASPQRLIVRALRAERVVLDAEARARWRAQTRSGTTVSLDGALVARTTRDAIVWFPGNFGWSPNNVGTEQLRGVEARGTVSRGPVSLEAWGTAYRSELVTGALRIPTPYVPTRAGGALLQIASSAMSLGVATRWLGPRPFTAGPRNPDFTLAGVSLVDLSVSTSHVVGPLHALLSLSLDNASDRAWQSTRGYPAPGRSWSLALTLRPTQTP